MHHARGGLIKVLDYAVIYIHALSVHCEARSVNRTNRKGEPSKSSSRRATIKAHLEAEALAYKTGASAQPPIPVIKPKAGAACFSLYDAVLCSSRRMLCFAQNVVKQGFDPMGLNQSSKLADSYNGDRSFEIFAV
jgi:hypothetical protein